MDIQVSSGSGEDAGILTIVLSRLEKKNAITAAMYQTMANALRNAEADAAIRVILFMGHSQIFTAGNDLDDFMRAPPLQADSPVFQFMTCLVDATKPVLAAVAGPAVGIGTTLLLHCDLVYAANNASFSMPFSQLGLCPEFASSLLLQQIAGSHRAAEKLFFGEPFSVEEAYDMGLVNRVLPMNELTQFAKAQARKLSALPAASVRTAKALMKVDARPAIKARIAKENQAFNMLLEAPEAKEAITAFFEKRQPNFRNLVSK